MPVLVCDVQSGDPGRGSGDASTRGPASRYRLAGPARASGSRGCGARERLTPARIAATMLVVAALGGCASVPPGSDFPKHASVAFPHPEDTKIAKQFADAANEHSGASGFRILSVGTEGFAIRVQLIAGAEHALDVQYFIFRGDKTGQLLTEALLHAADRGVHVRLLIDDSQLETGDVGVIALAAHPQIEIRLFNPFAYRGHQSALRGAEFLLHNPRLDFRMHNKLLVVDNAAALIGGRNVGDPYFQMDAAEQYADDDVFVVGPTVRALSTTFDEFWNSAFAIPVEALAGGMPKDAALAAERRHLSVQHQEIRQKGDAYFKRAESGEPLGGILGGQTPLVWATAKVVSDSPNKKRVVAGSMVGRLMYEPVAAAAAAATSELLMITPYFIPDPKELELLKTLRDRDVRVRILTNSLASTNELSAHSGYVRFRPELVQDGVELHELRAMLGNARGSGQTAALSRFGNYGLHGKLFVFDRRRLFIGSMNFDQRSMNLNTEIGLIIDSPELAEQTAARFEAMTQPANAYRVALRPESNGGAGLVWRTQEGGKSVEYTREPSRNVWRRFVVRFLRFLPLDREL